jgi:hypothetical protein
VVDLNGVLFLILFLAIEALDQDPHDQLLRRTETSPAPENASWHNYVFLTPILDEDCMSDFGLPLCSFLCSRTC